VFSAGVFVAAKHPAGAGKLVAYLASPELTPILARKGLSPP
jgi:ABC-type Fe3+ transport system substrate-binding protein